MCMYICILFASSIDCSIASLQSNILYVYIYLSMNIYDTEIIRIFIKTFRESSQHVLKNELIEM